MLLPLMVVALTLPATVPPAHLALQPREGRNLALQIEEEDPLGPGRRAREEGLVPLQVTLGLVSSVGFGAAGFLLGLWGGAASCGYSCLFSGAIIGSALGSGLLAPLGVLGAAGLLGARGSFGYSMALSLAGAVPSVILALTLNANNSQVALGVPLLSMALSTVGAVVGFHLEAPAEGRFSFVSTLHPTQGGLTVGLAGGW